MVRAIRGEEVGTLICRREDPAWRTRPGEDKDGEYREDHAD